jgi:hypothetical protein
VTPPVLFRLGKKVIHRSRRLLGSPSEGRPRAAGSPAAVDARPAARAHTPRMSSIRSVIARILAGVCVARSPPARNCRRSRAARCPPRSTDTGTTRLGRGVEELVRAHPG